MSIATELQTRVESLTTSVWPKAVIASYESVQGLWSDYGAIVRVQLKPSAANHPSSLVAKVVAPPAADQHPRGWNTDISRQRKLRSYQVERHFYEQYAARCADHCAVPTCFASERDADAITLLLQDLDASHPQRKSQLSLASAKVCLQWLAGFHATFLGVVDEQLWSQGTYWHLATRQEELAAMPDGPLKQSAHAFDEALRACRYKTLLHGDAKVANFCFSNNGNAVAGVDFQYAGPGCGMRDVAYFLGSCIDEAQLSRLEQEFLDAYFRALRSHLAKEHPNVDAEALEQEWRTLYAVAGADFHRFLSGWSPGHWKLTSYSHALVTRALHIADNHS